MPLFPDTVEVDRQEKGAAHRAFEGTEYRITKRDLVGGFKSGRYRDYLRFSFVRNPWDRLLSCYRSKIQAEQIVLKRTEYEGGSLYPGMSFREFAEVVCATPDEDANMHFRSQTPMLSGPAGGFLASYVGRFEHLSRDFAEVSRRIGRPLELPHANRSRTEDYRDSYDPELREMVGERYRTDVETFGYSFHGVR